MILSPLTRVIAGENCRHMFICSCCIHNLKLTFSPIVLPRISASDLKKPFKTPIKRVDYDKMTTSI